VLRSNPSVVFLDLGTEPSGLGVIQSLYQDNPDLVLVVGGPALSAEGLLAVMRAGASEYLPRPFSQDEAQEAFQRVQRKAKAKSSGRPEVLGKITAVFSAKGGTGVTTVATNLAVALRILTDKKVLLLDLAPALGTAAIAMGVQPRYNFIDVIQNFHRLDEDLFFSFLEVDDSGVHVLASPPSRFGLDMPVDEEVRRLLELCRQFFDFVVVDGGSVLSAILEPLLQESDDRLMVVTPDLPTLRNLKRALDLHGRTNGKSSPSLVLNQYKEGMGLTSKDVEEGLGHRIALVLEKDDLRVIESINVGRPEVRVRRSRLAKKIMDFAKSLVGPETADTTPRGPLSWFRRSSDARSKSKKETR
jgi:pilus assembly protein CpaE